MLIDLDLSVAGCIKVDFIGIEIYDAGGLACVEGSFRLQRVLQFRMKWARHAG